MSCTRAFQYQSMVAPGFYEQIGSLNMRQGAERNTRWSCRASTGGFSFSARLLQKRCTFFRVRIALARITHQDRTVISRLWALGEIVLAEVPVCRGHRRDFTNDYGGTLQEIASLCHRCHPSETPPRQTADHKPENPFVGGGGWLIRVD